nr:aminotransferase class I/II-fold pyridoxal phosphate-dependent enzyme [Bifidobacterium gallicum]
MVMVAQARAAGRDVIDLSVGNPDAEPAAFIREAAVQAVNIPDNARYASFDGKRAFLQAAAHWYRHTHGVDLNVDTELFAVEGAVDGLASLFNVLVSPGDTVAFVDPYYPSYHCMTTMLRGRELLLPAERDLGFLPDLDAVPASTWDRVQLLVLNYPNNPTGAQAPRAFFEQVIALAKRHHFAVIQDFAYAGLGVREQQCSILEIAGAKDVAVEVVSLSKMYGMAGWRAGFLAGNADLITAAKRYHYQMGSMVTTIVQDAAVVALMSDQHSVRDLAARYAHRRELVQTPLRAMGYDVFDAQGGLYTWMHAPQGQTGASFAAQLLADTDVCVLDGGCFGQQGADWVRLSLLQPEERLVEAVERIGRAQRRQA